MSLRIPVFISSVNNLSDARYCAGMGVRWLGFSTEDIGQRFSEADLKGMMDWVEGVEYVLEIRTPASETHLVNMEGEGFDYVLIDSAQGHIPDQPVIREVEIDNARGIQSLANQIPGCDFLLVTGENDLLNEPQIRHSLKQLATKTDLILGFGIDTDRLDWIEKELNPAGIMLKGGDEIRPGYKDFDELADILEYLETEDF